MIWTMKQGRGKWQRFRTGTMVAVHPLGSPKRGRRFAAKGLKQASTSVEFKIKRGATRRDGQGPSPTNAFRALSLPLPPTTQTTTTAARPHGGFTMKKTLYSLMLNDEVVREVDALAHRMSTNRSNLINQILAEYVNYTTPERRINDVLSTIQELMSPSHDFVPFFAPNSYSMSLKSSLEYKYRPTVKYEVELYRAGGDSIGELTVIFRTQSTTLIQAMTSFFRLWKRIEDAHLAPRLNAPVSYALYDGKFVRSISMPDVDCSAEELAQALSEYIKLFDKLMKGYLSGRLDDHEVEAAYFSHMRNEKIHV